MLTRILPILGVTFIDILGFSILLPILPYFVKHFGASDLVVGLLFSTFAACQFLAGPLWGNVSDRIGRKKVLIVSQIGATIGWFMLALAHSIGMVFIARIVEGASGGNLSVTQAYVADLVEPKQRGRAFSYVGASFSAGIVFGPLLGGTLYEHFGFSAPFLAAATLQFVTLIVTIIMLPESRNPEGSQVATLSHIRASLADPAVAPILLQMWAFSLALYAWFGVFALLLQAALGFNAASSSFFFASFGVLSVIMQLGPGPRIIDNIGDRRSSNIGIACALAGFLLVPFVHSVATLVPTFLLFGIGMAIARPALSSILTAGAPENQRGTILGVSSALDNLSGVSMPPLSTSLLGRYGPPWAGAVSSLFAFVALVMGLAAQRRDQTQSVEQPAELVAK
ncbi:MAG: MFS transporter [Candidatus Eremiobacteraeota bacterium]|nr:MFS transporter [Candidatus Eremiobacteraeota bacterium]MBV8461041.1 MFS transporter [Candidatus Eremiobacteraeota bacterium]MBV8668193.1 MFS transporter [Candidatus Eremiobacteraeota bacterium]